MTFGGHRQEDRHWAHTLRSLAAAFGVEGEVTTETVCVDRRRQWGEGRQRVAERGHPFGYVHGDGARAGFATRPFRRA